MTKDFKYVLKMSWSEVVEEDFLEYASYKILSGEVQTQDRYH